MLKLSLVVLCLVGTVICRPPGGGPGGQGGQGGPSPPGGGVCQYRSADDSIEVAAPDNARPLVTNDDGNCPCTDTSNFFYTVDSAGNVIRAVTCNAIEAPTPPTPPTPCATIDLSGTLTDGTACEEGEECSRAKLQFNENGVYTGTNLYCRRSPPQGGASGGAAAGGAGPGNPPPSSNQGNPGRPPRPNSGSSNNRPPRPNSGPGNRPPRPDRRQ